MSRFREEMYEDSIAWSYGTPDTQSEEEYLAQERYKRELEEGSSLEEEDPEE